MTRTIEFIRHTNFDALPDQVAEQALVCVVDLIAVALGGYQTRLSEIARRFALEQLQPGTAQRPARILFDGTSASAVGAAYANASMIDSFDAHDGHAGPMGHAGVALLPALLAFSAQRSDLCGREFLTALVVGYESALRAGMALTQRGERPMGSGAWNAIGCAAVGARLLALDAEATRHALGIADFNAPRSPGTRSVEYPTMVKDGAGPGAAAGTSAAFLARAGFTGMPALPVESETHRSLWESLGNEWEILKLNTKPFPIIKWAEPSVMAALQVCRDWRIRAQDIECIDIHTFASAVRIDVREPENTERAQYSLPFAVAVAIRHGTIRGEHLGGAALRDAEILRLTRATRVHHDPGLDAGYPAEQKSRVRLRLRDGRTFESEPFVMSGAQAPLSMGQAVEKLRMFGAGLLSKDRLSRIERALRSLPEQDPLGDLHELYDPA